MRDVEMPSRSAYVDATRVVTLSGSLFGSNPSWYVMVCGGSETMPRPHMRPTSSSCVALLRFVKRSDAVYEHPLMSDVAVAGHSTSER